MDPALSVARPWPHLVGKYSGVKLASWLAKLDTRAMPSLTHVVDFTAPTVSYGPPPVLRRFLRTVTREAPTIRREAARTRPPSRVEDAYVQIPTVPGESADHPGQTRAVSVSFGWASPCDPKTGLSNGKPAAKPVVLVKANGVATPVLQSAFSMRRVLDPVTFAFNQHRVGAPDTTLFSFVLSKATIIGESVVVGGAASGETVTFVYERATLIDKTTRAEVTAQWDTAR